METNSHLVRILRINAFMEKKLLIEQIISRLEEDCEMFMRAAKTAHDAATHQENIPDNKYDTLALESSYLAQGQANRAQEIKSAITQLKRLALKSFTNDDPIRLTALVELEAEDGTTRMIFLAPVAGGLTIHYQNCTYRVVTPESPLGRALLGCQGGDTIQLTQDAGVAEIISVQ